MMYQFFSDHGRQDAAHVSFTQDKEIQKLSGQATDGRDSEFSKNMDHWPPTFATSSPDASPKSDENMVEVEQIADCLFAAKEEEPGGEHLASWDKILTRIHNNLRPATIPHEILALDFVLAIGTGSRSRLSTTIMSIISRPGSSDEHLQAVRTGNGRLCISRNQLKPVILFSCPLCDHPRIRSFIKSQKWLQNSGYAIHVVEGTYSFLGIPGTNQLNLSVFAQWPCNVLCGTLGRLNSIAAAGDDAPYDGPGFTIGGILAIENELFGLTVGHILDSGSYAGRLSQQKETMGRWEKAGFQVGNIVHSTWFSDGERSDQTGEGDGPDCDWAIIRLNKSHTWATNFFLNNEAGRDRQQQLRENIITRFADEADINNGELLKSKISILAGSSNQVIYGRLKVTPVQLYLHGRMFVAREVRTEIELRKS